MRTCTFLMGLIAATVVLPLGAAVITVDADKTVSTVKPYCFGNNLSAADGRGIYEKPDAATFSLHGVKYAGGFWDPVKNSPQEQVANLNRSLKIGMMRYPGGCLAHNFNWKHAVGPLSERNEWKFGIDQYIALCRFMNWEPIITLTDYALPAEELPRHLAELVEYLNSPALPEHPWAMKRAEWGNVQPYNVKYFELGNESDHGGHQMTPLRCYSPEQYVQFAVESIKAIRKVDPTVKLGIVTKPGSGFDWNCEWNRQVIKGVGASADFLVIHFYGPEVSGMDKQTALKHALAYPAQVAKRLEQYRQLCRELAGKDMPLHITEFNIGSVANQPFPYRFSFMAGLMCADLMRLWQEPGNHVESAQYWQLLNGYWGAFRSENATGNVTQKRATLPFFEVWARYRGERIVKSVVHGSPMISAAPGAESAPMKNAEYIPQKEIEVQTHFPLSASVNAFPPNIRVQKRGDDEFNFKFETVRKNCYGIVSKIKRPAGTEGKVLNIRLTFEARYSAAPDKKMSEATIGLGLADSRGWKKTKSAIAIPCRLKGSQWDSFSGIYQTLPDTPGIDILCRLEKIRSEFSGTFEIRNLKASILSSEQFPPYPALATYSSLSEDGNSLYLLVFNRDSERAVEAEVVLRDFKTNQGNSIELYQKNVDTGDYFKGNVREHTVSDHCFSHSFPEHSLTAFEFKKQK